MRLEHAKKLHAVGVIVLSLFGSIAAVLLALRWGAGLLEAGLFCLMYSLSMVGITVGYHRCFAHGAFEAPPWLRAALAICGSMACQGPVIYWVANHRAHHRFTDAPGDPHSPYFFGATPLGRLRGLWHSHLGWTYSHPIPDTVTYAKDLMRSPSTRRLSRLYFVWVGLGLVLPALLGGLLTFSLSGAVRGLLWGGFVRVFVAYQLSLAIGSIAHSQGQRPFHIRGLSANNALLALPTFGEGWHQNHHAFPYSGTFGLTWWQLDLGAVVLRGLSTLGWVWNIKVPPASAIAARRATPDEAWGMESTPAELAAQAAAGVRHAGPAVSNPPEEENRRHGERAG
ncbi:acyl-CoA desaturase [Stigmatella aurantiaca]|uniref:Delta-9 acyl-lipid desaturase 1 n=1 Tax=Stigmatella aurantiaca (strain DW4/3-1) TaxID=378806 RepID=Q08U38_STIAD|nr:fatty acid desaturase [Stigmatella aurantiaca]ADO73864.1 Delta-9 acyl-lipid desaturase 1 [Stigmatella aurantiaca DW4/3-1]EAU63991.1 delta-9 acyl-lipid desaturase 1 [Stigmatella aurantiaca DW4/3-1]